MSALSIASAGRLTMLRSGREAVTVRVTSSSPSPTSVRENSKLNVRARSGASGSSSDGGSNPTRSMNSAS